MARTAKTPEQRATEMKELINEGVALQVELLDAAVQVWSTIFGLRRAALPLKASPSSIDSRISPTPKRPMTAIRKSKPVSSSVMPKVRRSWPVT